tara:strand:+ start:3418 stop:4839 length:1422 start_codon:yes stop_codon:yes gene_type:complete
MSVRLLLSLALIVSSPAHGSESSSGPSPSPNILIILVDDLGWSDVGYHNDEASTPNIDSIASKGVELDRFYVNPTCSPTRASLLTGLFSTTHGVGSPIQWHSKEGLPLKWKTMADYLRYAGYQTHLVGKWHLGNADTAYWPQARGFDSFYGFLNGGIGYFDHVFSGGRDWQRNGKTLKEEGYTTDLIADAVVTIIENRSAEQAPLFLFASFNAIHTPIEEPDNASIKSSGRRTLLRMISALDDAIGKILRILMAQEWGRDTIIIFASDNGGSSPKPWLMELLIPPMRDGYSSNEPLKQGKGAVFEGGIRVPGAIWWPDKIEAQEALKSVVHVADILPTLGDIVGFATDKVDGQSLKGLLLNGAALQERAIVAANLGSETLIRWPWKVIREASIPVLPEILRSDTWHLYNIEADPAETKDLQSAFPEQFSTMRAELLALPRQNSVPFNTDQPWDTFGGDETRVPWAEAASRADK